MAVELKLVSKIEPCVMLNWVDIHHATKGSKRTLNEKLSYLSRIVLRQIVGVKFFKVLVLSFLGVLRDFCAENNYPDKVVRY